VRPAETRPSETGRGAPVTERILTRLGRPRWLWVVLWSLVPLISPVLFVGAIRLSGFALGDAEVVNIVASQATLAYACFILLGGSSLLTRRAGEAQRELAKVLPNANRDDLLRGIDSPTGPLLLTAVVAAIVSGGGLARFGPLPPLVALPLLVVYLLPILTFVWVYLAILVGLDRVGRQDLSLDVFPEDRTLGLEALGSLASTGLGLLGIAVVPVLIFASDEPLTLGISLVIVAIVVVVFVLSMWRLHRQMTIAKARFVDLARRLYAAAYDPLRREPGIEVLERQASALQTAQALEERAESILTWPIEEETLRFMVVVITGVVTSLVVRGLFGALGA
jgi:hypothetical protein